MHRPANKLSRFVVVGVACAAVFFATGWFFRSNIGLNAFSSTIVAYAISFSMAYVLQKRWTFDSRLRHRTALLRYFGVQLAAALVTASIAEGIETLAPAAPAMFVSAASTIVAGGISFVLSSQWAFKNA